MLTGLKFAGAALAAATVALGAQAGNAQTVSAQGASISAAGNTIVATRVPVQVGTGAVKYFDVKITLTGTAAGSTPTGVTVTGSSSPSATTNTGGFSAGKYIDGNGNVYYVNGPGVGPGGSTSWALTASTYKIGCQPQSATWYTDTGTNNPEAARLTKAGIITSAYSFGVSGNSNCSTNWSSGSLIGASHAGNAVVISSFSYYGSTDNKTPVDTLTLIPN